MKSDTKKYYKIPQKMLEIFLARGYQELRVEDQSLFDPYYDSICLLLSVLFSYSLCWDFLI